MIWISTKCSESAMIIQKNLPKFKLNMIFLNKLLKLSYWCSSSTMQCIYYILKYVPWKRCKDIYRKYDYYKMLLMAYVLLYFYILILVSTSCFTWNEHNWAYKQLNICTPIWQWHSKLTMRGKWSLTPSVIDFLAVTVLTCVIDLFYESFILYLV